MKNINNSYDVPLCGLVHTYMLYNKVDLSVA